MSPRLLFQQELAALRESVADMGERVEIGYDKLFNAITTNDKSTMKLLLDVDRAVKDMQRSIEGKCLILLTKQQPVARDLRVISASLKVVTDIERAGDHVSDIAEIFLCGEFGEDFEEQENTIYAMMQEVKEMLHLSVLAFVNDEQEIARRVIAQDDIVDDYFNKVKEDMMNTIKSKNPDADKVVNMLMVAKYLEKIADHAVNICEWAVFQLTGDIEDTRLL